MITALILLLYCCAGIQQRDQQQSDWRYGLALNSGSALFDAANPLYLKRPLGSLDPLTNDENFRGTYTPNTYGSRVPSGSNGSIELVRTRPSSPKAWIELEQRFFLGTSRMDLEYTSGRYDRIPVASITFPDYNAGLKVDSVFEALYREQVFVKTLRFGGAQGVRFKAGKNVSFTAALTFSYTRNTIRTEEFLFKWKRQTNFAYPLQKRNELSETEDLTSTEAAYKSLDPGLVYMNEETHIPTRALSAGVLLGTFVTVNPKAGKYICSLFWEYEFTRDYHIRAGATGFRSSMLFLRLGLTVSRRN
jgi:hypothetical protein